MRTGDVVRAPPIDDEIYHLFLSHAWASGQDQMRVIKQRLGEMMDAVRVFLECVSSGTNAPSVGSL